MAAAAMAGVGLALQIGGAVSGEISRGKGAEAQAKGFDYDAQVADQNAKMVRDQTNFEVGKAAVLGRKTVGEGVEDVASSGVTLSGSALDVLQESAANAAADVQNLQKKGFYQARAYDQQAAFSRYKAQYTREAGAFDWGKVAFQVGGDVASAYPKIFNGPASSASSRPMRTTSITTGYAGPDTPNTGSIV